MDQKVKSALFLCIALFMVSCGSPAPQATPTSTPQPTATIPPTFTATPIPVLTVNQITECLTGPSSEYDVVGTYEIGQQVEISGRSSDGLFWIVKDDSGRDCWIDAQFATISLIETSFLPELTPPPVPTPAPPAAPSEITGTYKCEPQYKKTSYGIGQGPGNETRQQLVGMGIAITITWKDNAEDEIGYQLLRNGESLVILPPDASEYHETITFPGLTINTGFIYAVFAYNSAGKSVEIEVEIAASCQ